MGQLFSKLNILKYSTKIVTLLSSLLLSGGFALLATTGALSAGLGGPAGGAAVGAVTFAGVVTGLVPLAAAGALGILGRKFIIINVTVKSLSVIRSLLNVVYWPGLLHHTWRSVLYPGPGPGPWCSRLSSLLLGLACLSGQFSGQFHGTPLIATNVSDGDPVLCNRWIFNLYFIF